MGSEGATIAFSNMGAFSLAWGIGCMYCQSIELSKVVLRKIVSTYKDPIMFLRRVVILFLLFHTKPSLLFVSFRGWWCVSAFDSFPMITELT